MIMENSRCHRRSLELELCLVNGTRMETVAATFETIDVTRPVGRFRKDLLAASLAKDLVRSEVAQGAEVPVKRGKLGKKHTKKTVTLPYRRRSGFGRLRVWTIFFRAGVCFAARCFPEKTHTRIHIGTHGLTAC